MRRIAVVLAFTLALGAPAPARAQLPEGSTTLTGQPDSLLPALLTRLQVHRHSDVPTRPRRRPVEALVKRSAEPRVFRFETRGDSTTVTAQPPKGGMTAVVFGLGVVVDWLHGGA